MIDANQVIGTHNVLLITIDSLRYDVARAAIHEGSTPHLAKLLPGGNWEERRTHATFTFPAHQAFFAGFLPVPSGPERPGRLLACYANRGTTITDRTYVFNAPDIVSGLLGLGYHTACIGGVGFFSGQTPLGSVLPGMFDESYWSPRTGVDCVDSTRYEVDVALEMLERAHGGKMFLFMNISATHTPTHVYLPGATADSWETQLAALEYADSELGRLIEALPVYGPWLAIVCADHGDAFGEDGHTGHGIAHPTVWSVPYAETVIPEL